MARVITELTVCSDCLQVAANGREAGAVHEEGSGCHVERYAAAVERFGSEPVPCTWPGDGQHFSWYPCGFCGSRLGGDRFDAVILS